MPVLFAPHLPSLPSLPLGPLSPSPLYLRPPRPLASFAPRIDAGHAFFFTTDHHGRAATLTVSQPAARFDEQARMAVKASPPLQALDWRGRSTLRTQISSLCAAALDSTRQLRFPSRRTLPAP